MEADVAFEAMSDVLHLHGLRKLRLAIEYITDLLEHVDKLVVFAHHRDVVLALRDALAGYGAAAILGGVSDGIRDHAFRRFQSKKTPRVLIGNLQAMGVGHTLTRSDHVVFVEGSWVPSVMEQAADRCHRIGTVSAVTADVLVIGRSIDEHMMRRCLEKEIVSSRIVPESLFTNLPGDYSMLG